MRRKNILAMALVGGLVLMALVQSTPAPRGTQATFYPDLPLLHSEYPQSVDDLPDNLTRVDIIRIYNDFDLLSKAATYGWPGDGSAENPVVISGMNFTMADGSYNTMDALYIYSTTLHVRVENNYFHNTKYGVRFGNQDNIEITYNLFEDVGEAIYRVSLNPGANISISHNNFLNFTTTAVDLSWAYGTNSIQGTVDNVYLGYNHFRYDRTDDFGNNLVQFYGNNSLVENNLLNNTFILASGENYTMRGNVWYSLNSPFNFLAVRTLKNARIYNNVMLSGRIDLLDYSPFDVGGNISIEDNYFVSDQQFDHNFKYDVTFQHNYLEISNRVRIRGDWMTFQNNTVVFSGSWDIEVTGNNNTVLYNAVVNKRVSIVPVISDSGSLNLVANNTFSPDDTDGDGLTTYQEVMAYHTDPFDPDTDDDGIPDSEDPVEITVTSTTVSTSVVTTTETISHNLTTTETTFINTTETTTVRDNVTTVHETTTIWNESTVHETTTFWNESTVTETTTVVSVSTVTEGNNSTLPPSAPVPLSGGFVVLGLVVGGILVGTRRREY